MSNLTPYDTGAFCEPRVWPTRFALPANWGKVDFESENGEDIISGLFVRRSDRVSPVNGNPVYELVLGNWNPDFEIEVVDPGWSDRLEVAGSQHHGASAAYDAICAVIDRVKQDDDSLDTDEYAGMIIEALGGIKPPSDNEDMQECDRCGDCVYTLSSDGLCDGCVEEG